MDLTPDQQEILKQFRERVGHLVLPESFKPDHELARWLIARKFSLDRAEAMLLKCLEWRRTWNVDNILNWEIPEVLKKYAPRGLSGYDNDGCPVWILPYGGPYLRGIFQSCSYRDYIRCCIHILETSRLEALKQSEKLGKIVWKHSVIFDVEGLSLMHFATRPAKDMYPDLFQIYEAYYPEHLKSAFVVNAPKVFSVAFSIVRPFLADETVSRVQIYGKTGWKVAINEEIPGNQLPLYYGGTLTDPDGDPRCPSRICYGGEVPTSYYMTKGKQLKKAGDNYKTISLGRASKEVIEVYVPEPRSELKWDFFSDDFDVGFGISHTNASGEEEFMIPLQRVSSQLFPDEGNLTCLSAGTYNVIFDNEFSYLRSKKLKYNLEVISPSQIAKSSI